MNIEEVRIEELREAAYNPRKLTKKQAEDLKSSLNEFGFVDPIIVNSNEERKNIVIGGHQRLRIAKELGYETAPVFYLDIADIDKEKRLNLRLNKNLGEWDWDKLANEFDEEMLIDVGFSQSELGMGKGFDGTPEQDFTTEVLEENNYLVFTFDNSVDWTQVETLFGLKSVHALDSKEGYERKGVGRVIDGKELLKTLHADSNT